MSTQDRTGLPPLPELTDARIDELEEALFAAIAEETLAARAAERTRARRSRRRRAVWWSAAAAAAVIVAVVAVPPLLGGSGVSGAGLVADRPAGDEAFPAAGRPTSGSDAGGRSEPDTGLLGSGQYSSDSALTGREIAATAQTTLRAGDPAAAAQAIADLADSHGGYVESMNVDGDSVVGGGILAPDGVIDDATMPYPASGTWITVRVPAADLTASLEGLAKLGTVESSSITRQDVTEQAVDLRARVKALQASVDRLTALMGEAGSVSDLISAESALSDRQAELESTQQKLTSLESQVTLSSLTVSLVTRTEVVKADPAGFGDGLATGWNGLVATLNAVVVALGFLLPWLVVAGVVALLVWAVVRRRRRRRAAPGSPQDPDPG